MVYITNKSTHTHPNPHTDRHTHTHTMQVLEANRCYAIANRLLDVPWAKLERGKRLFHECLSEAAEAIIDTHAAHTHTHTQEEGEGGRRGGGGTKREATTATKGEENEDHLHDGLAHLLLNKLLHDKEECAAATDTGYPLCFESKLARICIPGVALKEEEVVIEEGGDGDGGVGGREQGEKEKEKKKEAVGKSVFGTVASIVILVTRDDRLLFYETGLVRVGEGGTGIASLSKWSAVEKFSVPLE